MDSRLQAVASSLKLTADLYLKALAGVEQEVSERRPNEHTNSLAFIACHVLDARFHLLKMAGRERTNPWRALFDAAADVSEMKEYPPLYELRAEWEEMHEATLRRLAEMTAGELDASSGARFPTEDESVLGAIAFLASHEAYHVGQMGFLRKYLGYDPVVGR